MYCFLVFVFVFLFFERRIRGGVSMVSKLHTVANNPYMESYDSKQPDATTSTSMPKTSTVEQGVGSFPPTDSNGWDPRSWKIIINFPVLGVFQLLQDQILIVGCIQFWGDFMSIIPEEYMTQTVSCYLVPLIIKKWNWPFHFFFLRKKNQRNDRKTIRSVKEEQTSFGYIQFLLEKNCLHPPRFIISVALNTYCFW